MIFKYLFYFIFSSISFSLNENNTTDVLFSENKKHSIDLKNTERDLEDIPYDPSDFNTNQIESNILILQKYIGQMKENKLFFILPYSTDQENEYSFYSISSAINQVFPYSMYKQIKKQINTYESILVLEENNLRNYKEDMFLILKNDRMFFVSIKIKEKSYNSRHENEIASIKITDANQYFEEALRVDVRTKSLSVNQSTISYFSKVIESIKNRMEKKNDSEPALTNKRLKILLELSDGSAGDEMCLFYGHNSRIFGVTLGSYFVGENIGEFKEPIQFLLSIISWFRDNGSFRPQLSDQEMSKYINESISLLKKSHDTIDQRQNEWEESFRRELESKERGH